MLAKAHLYIYFELTNDHQSISLVIGDVWDKPDTIEILKHARLCAYLQHEIGTLLLLLNGI